MEFSDNLHAYSEGYRYGYSGDELDVSTIPEQYLIPFYNGYEDGTDAMLRDGNSL